MNTKNTTQKIVLAAMFASLTCVATMIIKIPSPLKGYVNFGDCIVLLAGWLLSPLYGFLAAGLGSALADLLSGYTTFAAATFVIKGVMALIAYYGAGLIRKKMGNFPSQIISGAVAELWMMGSYFVFEGFLYGFAPSVVNLPASAFQGAAGLILGCGLIRIFTKTKMTF